MAELKFYKVGGCVRDELLGLKSKDIDYAVVASSYEEMKEWVAARGTVFDIPNAEKNYTIRANVPELGGAVDFVLCRKDGPYSDGRRPDWVKPGTIDDDLARRDFTMNAIAVDKDGNMYDPYGGIEHIKFKLITCVGVAAERFREDSLRMLRALRFCITKGFTIAPDIEECFQNQQLLKLLKNVSTQRIAEELEKMFRTDTLKSMRLFTEIYPALGTTIFGNEKHEQIWLEPTLRAR